MMGWAMTGHMALDEHGRRVYVPPFFLADPVPVREGRDKWREHQKKRSYKLESDERKATIEQIPNRRRRA